MGNHDHLKTAVDRNFLPAIVSYFSDLYFKVYYLLSDSSRNSITSAWYGVCSQRV